MLSNIKNILVKLVQQCEALPETDVDADLFGPKNYRSIILPYFTDLAAQVDDDAELCRRLSDADLTGDARTVYNRINGGGHPVRDYLILKGNGLVC